MATDLSVKARINLGARLALDGFKEARRNKELLVLSLLQVFFSIIAAAAFGIAFLLIETQGTLGGFINLVRGYTFVTPHPVGFFLFFTVIMGLALFLQAIVSAQVHLGNPPLKEGVALVRRRAVSIFSWVLLSAALAALSQTLNVYPRDIFASIVDALVGIFMLAAYFVIPIIIAEHRLPLASIPVSVGVLWRRLIETVVAHVVFVLIIIGVGFLVGFFSFGLVFIAIKFPGVVSIFLGGTIVAILGIFLVAYSQLAGAVLRARIYEHDAAHR